MVIIKSQYSLSEPEPSSDVAATLLDRALRFGDKVALVHSVTRQQYTYAELRVRVRQIAQSLYEVHGLRKGDVILLLSPNCPEYGLVMLGAVAIGVVVSTANPTYTVGEAAYHLEDCGAKYLVTSPDLVPKMQQACAKYGKAKGMFVFGEAPGCIPYNSLLACSGDRMPRVSINIEEDLALLPYSSGTTGTPKGVMITHFNLLYNVLQCSHPEIGIFASPGKETAVLFLPMYHMFGIVVMATALKQGNTLVVMPKYELTMFLNTIRTFKPTYIPVVPSVLVQLTKSAEVASRDFESVENIFYGAAPIGTETEKEWDEKFPNCKRAQGYGLTEVVTALSLRPWKVPTPLGSAGHLLPGMEARIIDPDTGRDVDPGKRGELLVQGKNVMIGYYRKPDRTAETIDSSGWLHTGDIVHIDQSGFFYVVDRLKELIKYKANQVAPAELENVLLGHPSVADCAVIGVPDVSAGELPRAYVVFKPGKSASHRQIQEFVAEHVAPFKRLRGGVKFVDVIPKSPSGKILRRILRDQIKQELTAKAKL